MMEGCAEVGGNGFELGRAVGPGAVDPLTGELGGPFWMMIGALFENAEFGFEPEAAFGAGTRPLFKPFEGVGLAAISVNVHLLPLSPFELSH